VSASEQNDRPDRSRVVLTRSFGRPGGVRDMTTDVQPRRDLDIER
jgi:hypothetical protein